MMQHCLVMVDLDGAIVRRSSACAASPTKEPYTDKPASSSLRLLSRMSTTVRNRIGERTEPCLTPLAVGNGSHSFVPIRTLLEADEYQLSRMHQHFPFIPILNNLSSNIQNSIEPFPNQIDRGTGNLHL